jgi:hypothetical protein
MTGNSPNSRRTKTRGTAWDVGVAAATVLGWAGFFVHNVADLPGRTITSAESSLPTIVWLVGLAVWVVAPSTRTAGAWMLLVWAVINLVGGALSVLPLPILPFEPEQTVEHYAFHGLYAATQIPLIVMTAVSLGHRVGSRQDDAPVTTGEVSRPDRSA